MAKRVEHPDEFDRYGIIPNVRMSGRLELQLRCWVQVFRLLRTELTTPMGLPVRKRIKAWRRGFISRSWMMYDLDNNDPRFYLADLPMAARFYKVNGFFNLPMGNKLLLSRLLRTHGVPHPEVVSQVIAGRLIEEDRAYDADLCGALERSLARHPHQVFRPTWSGSGQGVFFLDLVDKRLTLNGDAITWDDACIFLSRLDRYVATERVEQADYARAIYPGSTNTIRFFTLWDDLAGESLVAAVTHRFGTSRSAPLDNWHQGRGGLSAAIDPRTGVLGQGLQLSAERNLIWKPVHPETGAPIEGVVVPGFQDILKGIRRTVSCFPFCPCIGWDVVVTNNGYRIIEANPIPGLTLTQAHTPLLRNPRVHAVFERWGLAPGRSGPGTV